MTDAPPVRDMSEADWEAFAMETLAELAWEPKTGAAIAPGSGERESWSELILPGRLREAIVRLNPRLPESAVDEVVQEVVTARSRDAFAENHRLHTGPGTSDASPLTRRGLHRQPVVQSQRIGRR